MFICDYKFSFESNMKNLYESYFLIIIFLILAISNLYNLIDNIQQLANIQETRCPVVAQADRLFQTKQRLKSAAFQQVGCDLTST